MYYSRVVSILSSAGSYKSIAQKRITALHTLVFWLRFPYSSLDSFIIIFIITIIIAILIIIIIILYLTDMLFDRYAIFNMYIYIYTYIYNYDNYDICI